GDAAHRPIDEIVEPGCRPAEILVTRREMADHRIGGVDRLVGEEAGKARDREPQAGATTPSEKFSAVDSIAARATPASSRAAGSRPTMRATALRAAGSPPAAKALAT